MGWPGRRLAGSPGRVGSSSRRACGLTRSSRPSRRDRMRPRRRPRPERSRLHARFHHPRIPCCAEYRPLRFAWSSSSRLRHRVSGVPSGPTSSDASPKGKAAASGALSAARASNRARRPAGRRLHPHLPRCDPRAHKRHKLRREQLGVPRSTFPLGRAADRRSDWSRPARATCRPADGCGEPAPCARRLRDRKHPDAAHPGRRAQQLNCHSLGVHRRTLAQATVACSGDRCLPWRGCLAGWSRGRVF